MYFHIKKFENISEKALAQMDDIMIEDTVLDTHDTRAVMPTAFALRGVSSFFTTQYIRPNMGKRKARMQYPTLILSSFWGE